MATVAAFGAELGIKSAARNCGNPRLPDVVDAAIEGLPATLLAICACIFAAVGDTLCNRSAAATYTGGYTMQNMSGNRKNSHRPIHQPQRDVRFLSAVRMRGGVSPALAILIAIVVVAAVAAWWYFGRGGTAMAPTATTPASTTAAGAPEAGAEPAAPTELTVDQIYGEARKAMSDNRMVSPPGNNALEFYLKILDKRPDDTSAKDALRELFPFATAGVEDQINQNNMDEATRIMDLLTKADPSNYTLTILRSKMDAKKKQLERELAAKAQQEAAAAAAAATAAAPKPETAPTAETAAAGSASGGRATTAASTPKPAETPTAAPTPTPVQPQGESREVRVVSPPRPSYPPAAVRNRQSGWVEVEFTVAAGGEVQNAHVVGSQPSRVFDREAVRAVENAKFEPKLVNGQPVASTLRRRIEFKLNE